MTPKEKAIELYNLCDSVIEDSITATDGGGWENCDIQGVSFAVKKCALIAANQIADECNKYFEAISQNRVNYWVAVKAEIERL